MMMRYLNLDRYKVKKDKVFKIKSLKSAKAALLLTALALLNACSTSSETFDCEAGKGIGCKSISYVNRLVDKGHLELDEDVQDKNKFSSPILMPFTPSEQDDPSLILSDSTTVNRVSEQHLRVWLAPFQDAQGNLHEAGVVHSVLKPGFWQIIPRLNSHL